MPDDPRRFPRPPRLHAHGDPAKPRTVRPGRRSRWDASATITERDVLALRWIAEQYGTRCDVLRVLLTRLSPARLAVSGVVGEEALGEIVERWWQRGLVARHRLLGWLWVVPTQRALRLVGVDFAPWSPSGSRHVHVHAVGIVRLAVEPSIRGGRWVSDRELRHEIGNAHIPDGAVELSEQMDVRSRSSAHRGEAVGLLTDRIAIEVELARMSASQLRELVTRPRHRRFLRTVFYAGDEVLGDLAVEVARVRRGHRFEVQPLPQVDGTTYGGAR